MKKWTRAACAGRWIPRHGDRVMEEVRIVYVDLFICDPDISRARDIHHIGMDAQTMLGWTGERYGVRQKDKTKIYPGKAC